MVLDMSESFAQLFETQLITIPMTIGSIIPATVVAIDSNYVTVNAGLKSESLILIEQFKNPQGELEIAVGDVVQVALEAVEDGFGETRLSRERAKRAEAWTALEEAHAKKRLVRGIISSRVKGGFTVDLNKVRAFLPGSLMDVKSVREAEELEGKEFDFKIIKIDVKRNNVVVSRRVAVENDGSGINREALLETLEEGVVLKGTVKNLTDYGAFVDLGGIDGLLHITDMSWKRVKHPSEILRVGDVITVKVLKFDRETARISLGLKQMGEDPWSDIARRFPVNSRLFGEVTNITDYGCFVEIEDGIEGLVHVSEMDWTNKNINPNKVVHLGQEVEVIVLGIDEDRRRISLGLKQCQSNPWTDFATTHKKGDRVSGTVKSITDFGIFIGLEGGIDGLVHLSDISWHEVGEEAIRRFKKGDRLESIILAIDSDRERISLDLKQLDDSPMSQYLSEHERGSAVMGNIIEITESDIMVELMENVKGQLPLTEVEDVKRYAVGDNIEAKVVSIDRKLQVINLSLKSKERKKVGKTSRMPIHEEGPTTTLGDIFKEQVNNYRDLEDNN